MVEEHGAEEGSLWGANSVDNQCGANDSINGGAAVNEMGMKIQWLDPSHENANAKM